jgi:hypothetical protein
MSDADLFLKISSLPEDVRKQVLELIDRLMKDRAPRPEPPRPKRKLGLLKGKIKISDDFDAPLDDMKDYME